MGGLENVYAGWSKNSLVAVYRLSLQLVVGCGAENISSWMYFSLRVCVVVGPTPRSGWFVLPRF